MSSDRADWRGPHFNPSVDDRWLAPTDGIDGEILRPRSVDDEAAQILDELNALQTWLTLKMRTDGRLAISAVDLVQRTRILIIERCKR